MKRGNENMRIEMSLRQAFEMYGRGNDFTYDGFEVLEEYLEECGIDTIDVIGITSDFDEMSIEEAIEQYEMTLEELEEQTLCLYVEGNRVIVQSF